MVEEFFSVDRDRDCGLVFWFMRWIDLEIDGWMK